MITSLSSWLNRIRQRCPGGSADPQPIPPDWLEAALGACLRVAERDHGGALTPFLDKIDWSATGLSRPMLLVWWSAFLARRRAAGLRQGYRIRRQ